MTASIWYRSPTGPWVRRLLAGAAFALTGRPLTISALDADAAVAVPGPHLRHCRLQDRSCWALMVPPARAVWVSGRRTRQLQVLRHGDSLWWPGVRPFYFSTERETQVTPFPGSDHTTFCIVCKTPITPGQPACQCPGCDLWAHDDPASEHPCFSDGETCVNCGRATRPDGGFVWLPESA